MQTIVAETSNALKMYFEKRIVQMTRCCPPSLKSTIDSVTIVSS